jgi:hypothetical protein
MTRAPYGSVAYDHARSRISENEAESAALWTELRTVRASRTTREPLEELVVMPPPPSEPERPALIMPAVLHAKSIRATNGPRRDWRAMLGGGK